MFSQRTRFDLQPNALAVLRENRQSTGRPVLDLTLSNPTLAGFEYPERQVLGALARKPSLIYEPHPFGLASAREAVSHLYQLRDQRVAADDICLTSSTSEAYSYLFKLLADAGATILVPRPSYPLFEYLAAFESLRIVGYPLHYSDDWFIDLDTLADLARKFCPRAILLVHPNNPTGSFVKREEWTSLRSIAHQCEAALICDEVFFDYRSTGENPLDLALQGPELVFLLNGLSKLLVLPQAKLSWIAIRGPEGIRTEARARLELIADSYLSVNSMVQHALPDLLELRPSLQRQVAERIQGNLATLRRLTAGSVLRVLKVEGGWYVVVQVPIGRTDETWALSILEDFGVYLHPGSFYGFGGSSYLVLSLLPEPESFAQGVTSVVKAIEGQQ